MKHKDISEKYRKWVIQYCSERFLKPVSFCWLTDTSDLKEPDLLLVNESNRIMTAKSNRKLIKRIHKSTINLPDSEKTKAWLEESIASKKISATKYDLRKMERKILDNNLKAKDIEGIINFINLYEDYREQVLKQRQNSKTRAKRLNKVWHYYYDQIFFPRFNRTDQKKYIPPKLKINNKKLLREFSEILFDFESKFEFIKK